ncbi:MAG: hypothetical protein HYT36_00655 [Candidatus Staskawiczbacteria bacterium]|nr:hypothetical protein [Candidatus Staskawiczbacteria bacterium]
MVFNQKNKIYNIYLSLAGKYKKPDAFWREWCKEKKNRGERERIVLGAILTQRTSWQNVEMALKNLAEARALSIEKIYNLGLKNMEQLEKLIKPSGFYRQKAKRLFLFCKFIIKNHKSFKIFLKHDLKTCRDGLLEIYGIGPETADSILLYAGSKPVFVIDEYTRRLCQKYGISDNISYDYLQDMFQKSLPKDVKIYQDFHAMIVLEGKNKE